MVVVSGSTGTFRERLRERLSSAGVFPKKKLGQNFLADERILDREVELSGIKKGDTVLEIGPGLGFLTGKLAEVCGNVVAIEKDHSFEEALGELKLLGVSVIYGDALKTELPEFDVCVSNPPYNISSPLLFRLLERDSYRTLILSFQEEFARRLIAKPGERNFGRLGASTGFVADIEFFDRIPRQSFYPPPKVDSRIIRVTRKKGRLVSIEDWKVLCDTTLNWLFQHPAKNVKNALKRKMTEKSAIREELLKKRVRTLTREEMLEIHRTI